jgi:Terminase small subunit
MDITSEVNAEKPKGPKRRPAAGNGTKRKPRPLTPAQEKFCQEYALHRNASEAYRQAYPRSQKWKPENLHLQASKLLRRPQVATRVDQLLVRVQAIAERKFNVTAERIVQELAAIAFANADDFFAWGTRQRPVYRGGRPLLDALGKPVTEAVPVAIIKPSSALTREQKAAVAGVETSFTRDGRPVVSVKLADKRGALRNLAQHLGLFEHVEQVKHAHAHVHLEVPDITAMTEKREALAAFERFRLKLQAQPQQLPAPEPLPSAA